ncbi:hypothetical protein [Aestuariivirga sp.]|uniref:hypothetical protein n=1 Tax=Aestuariivirga sp. TaxID=2650926 RepID=UPI0039E54BE3
MESERGRWFLQEYAKRQRAQETQALLSALSRLEAAVKSNQDMIAERLTKAMGLITTMDAKMVQTPGAPPQARPAADAQPQHANYFEQDEELFEPLPAVPAPARAEPKIETSKGATLVIRRRNEGEQPSEAAPSAASPDAESITEAQPKNRIVIIRHKAGEEIDVPLQDELRESA